MERRTAWLFAVVLLAGCAAVQRENFVKERAGAYVYEMPIEQVWPHVGAMLKEQGYSYKEAPGRFLLVTEWKEENGASEIGATFSRYMAEGQKMDDTHCRVRFVRHTMSSAGPVGDMELTSNQRHAVQTVASVHGSAGRAGTAAAGVRDLHAEWLLLQRVVPEDAKEIRDEADQRFK